MVTLRLDDHTDTDRYDIKESFEALDVQKTGRLDFELAYSLLLGLGYITDYKKKDEFNHKTLEEAARRIESVQNENYNNLDFRSGIKLETLLTIVDTHPTLSKGDRSESFASKCFKLLDRGQKGYITASDVEQLGDEVGTIDSKREKDQQQRKFKISTNEANEMIETANKIFAESTTARTRGTNSNEKNGLEPRLQPSVFEKLFEPSFQ